MRPESPSPRRSTAAAVGLLIFLAAPPLSATPTVTKTNANSHGSFGLGLVVGEPIGVGGRYWFSENVAVQGLFGGTYRYEGAILAIDVIAGIRDIIPVKSPSVRFDLSLGAGALAGVVEGGYHCHGGPWPTCHRHSSFATGLRAPVTFSVVIEKIQLEAFIEAAPVVLVLPFLDLDLEGGFGARYYF
jgi:hypothetical protein